MKKHLTYKEAIKRQFSTVLAAFILTVAVGWELYPINTPYKTVAFTIFILAIGAGTIWYVRKSSFKQICVSCGTDIFPFVELGNSNSTPVKYCPICGEAIEI